MLFAPYAGVGQKAQVIKAVAQEDAFCGEGQAAVSTKKYAFIVTLEVVQHGAAMAEAVFAFWAREAPLVSLYMSLARCYAGKNALAEIALVELVFEMIRVQMLLQLLLCGEPGCANDALGLCMRAQVFTIVR